MAEKQLPHKSPDRIPQKKGKNAPRHEENTKGRTFVEQSLNDFRESEFSTRGTFHNPDDAMERLLGGRRSRGAHLGFRQEDEYNGWRNEDYK